MTPAAFVVAGALAIVGHLSARARGHRHRAARWIGAAVGLVVVGLVAAPALGAFGLSAGLALVALLLLVGGTR